MFAAGLGVAPGKPLSILCLGAHSDDVEIGCGGSLLRLLSEHPGSTVHWEVFSATAEREREAIASGDAFLADAAAGTVVVNGFTENRFPEEWGTVKDHIATLPRIIDPDIVFTHRRDDAHQDHRTIGELTWQTFRDHLVVEYEIPKFEGDLGQPNLFVPLTAATAERKIELICEHFASQRNKTWFRPEVFRGLMHLRGAECNSEEGPAEAFHARKMVV
jgi:LmbE family N-acetylglucosaminyl deacetylase